MISAAEIRAMSPETIRKSLIWTLAGTVFVAVLLALLISIVNGRVAAAVFVGAIVIYVIEFAVALYLVYTVRCPNCGKSYMAKWGWPLLLRKGCAHCRETSGR
jgi:predicted lysophospholipase L1 biosynthesis ABC-type transport system permease subunit